MSDLPHLTIAYLTNRVDCRIEWFLDSLRAPPQTESIAMGPHRIIVVDYHHAERDFAFRERLRIAGAIHTPPKPCVWQGKNQLLSKPHFAAANARNTALLVAPDGWIAYVDDLSVLHPTWLASVHAAMRANYIVFGAYRKVKNLVVENGSIASFEDDLHGWDSRWGNGAIDAAVPASGSWLFGCSVAMPVEALLKVNGWDEDCDGLGSEDYICGMMLSYHNYAFRYDRRMLTFESQELHSAEPAFTRYDKGVSPDDKSHAIFNMVSLRDRHVAPNYFGPGGIRPVRDACLGGAPYPDLKVPDRDWFDGQPLCER